MNNTLCLGIFAALVYFRELDWFYSAGKLAKHSNCTFYGPKGLVFTHQWCTIKKRVSVCWSVCLSVGKGLRHFVTACALRISHDIVWMWDDRQPWLQAGCRSLSHWKLRLSFLCFYPYFQRVLMKCVRQGWRPQTPNEPLGWRDVLSKYFPWPQESKNQVVHTAHSIMSSWLLGCYQANTLSDNTIYMSTISHLQWSAVWLWEASGLVGIIDSWVVSTQPLTEQTWRNFQYLKLQLPLLCRPPMVFSNTCACLGKGPVPGV